jgi:Domain of unknown function(DUF2779)
MGHLGLSHARVQAARDRIRRTTAERQAELDREAAEQLRGLPYPRYYLAFATIAPAVPLWVGTSAYQPLPFQWSCHIENEDSSVRHAGFLETSGEPPLAALAEHLLAILGTAGPVFTYTRSVELVIIDLAEMFPNLADRLTLIIDRLIDLRAIAQAHYFHLSNKGAWTLTGLLPTIAPDLADAAGEVQAEADAGRAYIEVIDPTIAGGRRKQLISALRAYCKRDTLALVHLAKFLQR